MTMLIGGWDENDKLRELRCDPKGFLLSRPATPAATVAEHRALAELPADGDYDTSADWYDITGGKLAVLMQYTAAPGADAGYPCYRVAWRVTLPDTTVATVYETVKLGAVTPDGPDAPITRLTARVECEDLTDGDGDYRSDVIEVLPGADGVRIEPAELGDIVNAGSLAIWLGSAV